MDILEIITHITEFIQYFATGLLFFGAYSFAACLLREEQSEYFVVKGITASFVINVIDCWVFDVFKINSQYFQVTLVISAIIFGLFFGRARQFKWFRAVIEKMFGRTVDDNLFVLIRNLANPGKCVSIRFTIKDDDKSYEGQIDKIAAIHKEPVIFLKYYMIQDQAGNEKMDFSECDCAYMIVKWSQMENVQIAYEE